MKILITGSEGFLGKNLSAKINALNLGDILSYDVNNSVETLKSYAAQADFVFHLAGVNRPKDNAEFYTGNRDLTEALIQMLSEKQSKTPVVFSSTIQAGNGSDYAKSKEEAEKMLLKSDINENVFIYRLPNIFGKWSLPNYNTVVATFCHNAANGMPLAVRDPNFEVTLCYVDDVVDIFLEAMKTGQLQEIQPCYTITLGKLAETISAFANKSNKLKIWNVGDPFIKKLYATYLSFLPKDKFSYSLTTHQDDRGSFTEFLHLPMHGQVSVNISKPGIEKGNHWHNTKHEKFLVVHGKGIIKLRKINTTEILEYFVNGEKQEVVDIPPGYTHNICNLGDSDMITVMWANEIFDSQNPDTYFEKV